MDEHNWPAALETISVSLRTIADELFKFDQRRPGWANEDSQSDIFNAGLHLQVASKKIARFLKSERKVARRAK